MPQTGNCFALRGSWEYWQSYRLLFTPFPATRFAMHRIYANRINSRGMSRVFCDLRSQKTPRGILPVNSNFSMSESYKILQAPTATTVCGATAGSMYGTLSAATSGRWFPRDSPLCNASMAELIIPSRKMHLCPALIRIPIRFSF